MTHPTERMRLARLADVEPVLELMQQYYAHDGLDFDVWRADPALIALIKDPRLGEVWLVEVAAEVVGYVALCFGYSLECGGRDAFIDELFLLPSHRGQGLGTRVIEHVLARCRELELFAVRLEVMRHNADALRLYTRLGFEEHDRYLMTRRLPDPP
jgi:ribosomal protein S18 acetylase RimI-like enzyme